MPIWSQNWAYVRVNLWLLCCWLKEATENNTTDSLWSHMAHSEWMNKHVMQYPHTACACVCQPVYVVCLLKVSYASPASQIPLALLTNKHHYTHTDQYISLSPYCQDCVYVEADNTTGLNPSTCDFLQTGLVPVFPLNSSWNTGESRAAGWSTGRGPNPLFHVPNALLLLSKWTALLSMWNVASTAHALFSTLPSGQRSRAEWMHDDATHTVQCPSLRRR